MRLPPSRELRWINLSKRWIEHADAVAAMTRSASEVLLAACAPTPGERWLDLASGVGDPGHALAHAVGPAGLVLASDGVPAMVAACMERRAPGAPLRGLVQRAEQLAVADGSLHGVSCRFGAMFFDDLGAALAETRRVLRPGGRLGWLVWGRREANPYFTATMEALDHAGAAALDEPTDAPTVFELARPDALAAPTRAAGFADVHEERLAVRMDVACPAEGLLDLQARLSERVEARVASLGSEALDEARARTAAAVAPWCAPAGLELPAEVVLVRARR